MGRGCSKLLLPGVQDPLQSVCVCVCVFVVVVLCVVGGIGEDGQESQR
jgi:hypothetical protein